MKHNFKETKITSDVIIKEENSKKVALLLSRVIQIIESKNEPFIIDTAHVFPEDIVKYIDKNKWQVFCVGYPNISVKEKFDMIRKYDDESDWTYSKKDDELQIIIKDLVEISKKMEEQCKKMNIEFIDSSNWDNIKKKF